MGTLVRVLTGTLVGAAVLIGSDESVSARPAPNSYPVVLSGDFTGDGVDDLFFHSPGSSPDVMYDFRVLDMPDGPQQFVDIRTYSVRGSYRPVVGDLTGDDVDDILWYQPGTGADVVWDFAASSTSSYQRRVVTVNGTYKPVAGDFTGDGVDDVFFYAPGPAGDFIWELSSSTGALQYRSVPQRVSGTAYVPVAGRFWSELGGAEDIFWYNPAGTESMWDYPDDDSLVPRKSSPQKLQIMSSLYKLAVSDIREDGYDDIVFVGPGNKPDSIYDFQDVPGIGTVYPRATPEPLVATEVVAVGLDAWGEGSEDFFVYEPVNTRGSLYDSYVFLVSWVFDRYDADPAPVTSLANPARLESLSPDTHRWRVPMSPAG